MSILFIRLTFFFSFIFVLSFFFLKLTFSQPATEWLNSYNGPANSFDIVSNMALDYGGNVYLFGSSNGFNSSSDITIVKYKNSGSLIWERRINGSGNSADQTSRGTIDDRGNSYVTGFTTDTSMSFHIVTVKYDSSGNKLWERIFRHPDYVSGSGRDITFDNTGNILVCGYLRNLQGTYDIVTIKYSTAGSEIASVFYNGEGNGNDFPVKIKSDNSGSIIILGTSKTNSLSEDIIVLKYSPSFSSYWKKAFDGTANGNDGASDFTFDADDNIYFCGNLYNDQSSSDYYYVKLDPDGEVIWQRTYDGTGNSIDIPSSMQIDSQKNIYITGFSRNSTNIGSEDVLTLKISSSGSEMWTARFNGNSNGSDQGNCIALDNNGNVYVGGASDRGNVQMTYALLKYNSSGNFLWNAFYSLTNVPEDFIYDIALDNQSNVYVTGISLDTANDYDFTTIKYSQTIGISNSGTEIPNGAILFQNYPNPFNPVTKINYDLRIKNYEFVSLKIFNVRGMKVAVLVNEKKSPGSYSVEFDAGNLPSGVYYYKLETDNFTETKKMILIK